MPEGDQQETTETTQDESTQNNQQEQENEFSKLSPEELAKQLRETRAEARERRKTNSTLQKQLDEISNQQKETEKNKLKEEGKNQELLQLQAKELGDLKLQLQALEKIKLEKEEQEEIFRKELLNGLSKDQQNFLKDKSIAEIKKGRELFGVKTPIDVDSGRSINGQGDIKLSDLDAKKAEEMGLSPKGYMELKRRERMREQELTEKFDKLNKQKV